MRLFAGDGSGGLASVPAFDAVDAKILLSLIVWYYVVDTTLNLVMLCGRLNKNKGFNT